jgi:hypothetical protein
MRIAAYGATSAASASVKTQPKANANAAPQSKAELKETDGFKSSQLPAGVGEKLNIKA